jgi:outer membrane protein
VGLVLSFPLSNKGPRNAYKATKAEREQAMLRLQQFEQNVMVQIDDAIKRAQTSLQRVQATRSAREYAEAALQAEQRKLEAGKSTSFVVLQLQRDVTAARSEEIRALTDYNKSLAQEAFAEGASLDRNHLRLPQK